ncbi:MAG TPA: type VI secretion system baseplate subunit TssK [Planctomycetota bacterium]|nr:type VI secretion system baseplate subunit TssK [Planctomycetota bacterium]
MEYAQKVLWSEGMFLTPHHFQQADRYYENLISRRLSAVRALGWGVCRLQINGDALANGEVVLSKCSAILPDGLAVDTPDLDPLPPARPVEGFFDAKRTSLGVYLASPLARAGAVAFSPEGATDGRATRYHRRSLSAADENSGGSEREVVLAAKTLRILFEGEPLDDFVTLKIAELQRSASGKYQLSEAYVPPCLFLSSSAQLAAYLRRILEMLSAKSSELAGQRRQRSAGLVEFTMSEAANFWFLHTVNATIPVLMHLHNHADAHPEDVFLVLARLAGELFTFSGEGHPKDLPQYAHDAVGPSFAAMEKRISDLMGTIIPTKCAPVPLEKTRESLFTGRLRDDRLLEGQFYLAVMAEVPEDKIIREVPMKAKVAASDRVDQLIAAALRGLTLRHLPTPPSEIPVQPGRQYFQVDKAGDHWEAVKKSRTISFYIPPEFKNLKLELMGVKE